MNRFATTRPLASASSRAPAPPTLPPTVNNFVATELLHDGPWSQVYRARPASGSGQHDAPYAIKLASAKGQDLVVAGNMLRREIRVMRSVAQANLVTLLDYRLEGDASYLLTPYLEGATLRQVFDAGLRCPLGHALWVARQMAQALAALHEAGWRHGDLKPDNVLVSPSGHATLLDLGLAQPLDVPVASAPQRAIAGSLAYLAPECLQSGAPVGASSDIYSLGVVLFQMLAGRPPFAAPHAASLIEAQLHATPPAPPVPGCAAAGDVRQLVARMLAKDPLRRPASASQVADRLMRLEIATLDQRLSAA